MGNAGACCIRPAFSNPLRIDVYADTARPKLLDRGDHDSTVATAEVVDHIVCAYLRKLQHPGYDVVRGRLVANIRRSQHRLPGPDALLASGSSGRHGQRADGSRYPAHPAFVFRFQDGPHDRHHAGILRLKFDFCDGG